MSHHIATHAPCVHPARDSTTDHQHTDDARGKLPANDEHPTLPQQRHCSHGTEDSASGGLGCMDSPGDQSVRGKVRLD